MSDIQIVAEIGCNHNGSVELAKKMMKKAKEAGACLLYTSPSPRDTR